MRRVTLAVLCLTLFAFSCRALDQLSLAAQQPFLSSLPRNQGDVFASMCIGTSDELIRRCLIAAARWRHVVKDKAIPLIYYIQKNFPSAGAQFLRSLQNVHVVILQEFPWPASETYPTPPKRLYSFYKLAAFNLFGYRVLWVDSDAYLLQDPTFLFDLFPTNSTGDEVLAWKAPAKKHKGYFNSGIMVFKPTKKTSLKIFDAWTTGNFRLHVKGGKIDHLLTEQEVLLTVFRPPQVHAMPNCVNFRLQKSYQKTNNNCDMGDIVALHNVDAFARATSSLCPYWEHVLKARSHWKVLCDADQLVEGAPSFSLENCREFFTPPSEMDLCRGRNNTAPYI